MTCKTVTLLFLILLPAFCQGRAIGERNAWGSKLDLKEKNVQEFLKHNKVDQYIHEVASGHGVTDDSEPGDAEEEDKLRLQNKEKSRCVHPKTLRVISVGSFDFDEASCMMCECPSSKLKCYKTC